MEDVDELSVDNNMRPIVRSESLLSIESREFCESMEDFMIKEMEKNKKKNRLYYGKYKLIKDVDCLVRNEDICPICMDFYKSGTYKRKLGCNHVFHKKCIDKWFKRLGEEDMNLNCPICRKSI